MEMNIISSREREVEGGKETIFERYEALHCGMAVQAGALRHLGSPLLVGSLFSYLERAGLTQEGDEEGLTRRTANHWTDIGRAL
jgi:hypothetical protein